MPKVDDWFTSEPRKRLLAVLHCRARDICGGRKEAETFLRGEAWSLTGTVRLSKLLREDLLDIIESLNDLEFERGADHE